MQPWSEVARAIQVALQAGDFERAHALIDPYEALADETNHTELAGKVAFYRGVCFDTEGRHDEAIRAFRDAIDFDTEELGEESLAVAHATSSLALAYTNAGRAEEAADAYVQCEELYRALGRDEDADSCLLQACQRLVELGDYEGVLELEGVITSAASPAHRVSWLVLAAEARRCLPESDPAQRTENMLDALDAATRATRITEPASPALREALRRAWLSYALLELCFRNVEAGGLAYSMAMQFARNQSERDWIAARAASFAAEGMDVVLTTIDPGAFVLAKKGKRYLTVLHRDHGVRVVLGETSVPVGASIDLVLRDGAYTLA